MRTACSLLAFVPFCLPLVAVLGAACTAGIASAPPDAALDADVHIDAKDAMREAEAAVACDPAPEFTQPATIMLDFRSYPPGGGCNGMRFIASLGVDGAGTLTFDRCGKVSFDGVLTAAQGRMIQDRIGAFCEVPMPSRCMADGYQYTLTLGSQEEATTFLFDDYECRHRKDVRYARGGAESLLTLVKQWAEP